MDKKKMYDYWQKAFEQENYELLDKIYKDMIKIFPETLDTSFSMGLVYSRLAKDEEAIRAFQRSIEIEKNSIKESFFELGNIYLKNEELDEAKKSFQKVLEMDGNYFEARFNLAKVYGLEGKTKKAILEYQEALKIKDDEEAWVNLGVEYSQLLEDEKSLEAYKKALEINPRSYLALTNIGIYHSDKNDFSKALDYQKKALEYNSFYETAWYNLACVYSLLEEDELALKALKNAIRLEPENKKFARDDEEFDYLRDNEEFYDLLDD